MRKSVRKPFFRAEFIQQTLFRISDNPHLPAFAADLTNVLTFDLTTTLLPGLGLVVLNFRG